MKSTEAPMEVDLRPVTDTGQVRALVQHQGFAVIDHFVSLNQIQSMRTVLLRLIHEDLAVWRDNPHYRDSWMVMNLMFRDPLFVELLNEAPFRKYAEAVIGPNAILYSFTSSSMPPAESNFSRRIHVDSPRFIPGYPTNVGFIMPLTDFAQDNGGTEVLPFSHLKPDEPTPEDFADNSIVVEAKMGQALLFNARLWHSGGVNSTQEARHALTINMCRSYMRQHFDFPRMVNEIFSSIASEEAYSLIGWDVRMPSCLEEYYVDPKERLYQPNQG
jgi:hypothetical protein